jgi:glycosyltransferase involved in cell wall biosynthesis
MSRRILMLVDRYYPSDHAFLENVYSKILPNNGYRIYWVMRSSDSKKRIVIKRWNNSIVLVFKAASKNNILSRHISNMIIFIMLIRYLGVLKPHVIQVRNWTWGAAIAKYFQITKSIPFVFQNSFPSDQVLLSRLHNASRTVRIRSHLELLWRKKLIYHADLIFPISERMKSNMIDEGFSKRKLVPIGLGYDGNVKREDIDSTNIIEKYDLKNKKVVLYFGVMDKKRELEFLIDVWALVTKAVKDGILLMVGGNTHDISRLSAYSQKIGVDDKVLFVGHMERKEIPKYIKSALLTVSPIPPIPLYQVSSVTKLYESLGLHCPVVGNDLGEQTEVLRNSDGGLCVEYEKKQFSAAIVLLIEDRVLARKLGDNGYRYIARTRSYDSIASDINSAYRKYLLK